MGNTPGKPHQRPGNKKYLQFLGAERPSSPGKPYLAAEPESAPDVLTIRWDPPSKNGGSPITGYLVEHRRTGSPHWVRASPVKVRVPELTTTGLEPGWRYQFRVFAENLVGLSEPSELSEPLTITLARSGLSAPKFTQELRDAVALENEKVEFVVRYVGRPPPKLCWFKDGFEIFSSRRTRILTEHDRSVLTIHQSAVCDEGEIKCTATNKAGHVSTRARLTLEAPPSVRLPRQYEEGLLFEIGELIRLKVSVAGLPPPLVFWSHNGESIEEGSERYEIDNDDRTSTLRIAEAERGDRGEYRVKAVNKLGSDLASFLVTVTDKPSPPGKARVVMTLGRSVTLSWNTPDDDGGCKIGSYIIEYYRLGWNVWLKAATSRQLTTVLGDLIEGSEYKFRVKAESPFGVSEPSEESDLVFIPDPKRGITEPVGRGRSQEPEDPNAPTAAKRRKPPRSQSSSRTEEPSRPDRSAKITSPPKTPDRLSPRPERKDVTLNRAIFDRSIESDIAYGSPEIKIKKTDVPVPKEIAEVKPTPQRPSNAPKQSTTVQVIEKQNQPLQVIEKQNQPLQVIEKQNHPPQVKEKSPSPIKEEEKKMVPEMKEDRSPDLGKLSARRERLKSPKLSRDNSENLGGSTEFMMVLYSGENQDMGSEYEFGMDDVPPPLSLSAPELGTEPPSIDTLRLWASSTELLHERAMVRFYQEALAEEEAIQRRRAKSEERKALPKIQVNSRDLERKHSLRRRLSAGGAVPQQVLWAQKRQSWRGSNELADLFEGKTTRNALTVDEKRELMSNRQRSHSEEMEEEEFEKVRRRMAEQTADVRKKKTINVLEEDVWDYSEEEEEPSDDERFKASTAKPREPSPEEEDVTYHPRAVVMPQQQIEAKSKFEEPFEILTKPAKLPDANFVPKPILKKKENGEVKAVEESRLLQEYSQKPLPALPVSKKTAREVAPKTLELRKEPTRILSAEEKRDTSAVTGAGIAAAGIIISQPMLQQKEAEEARSVIAHYGDIVKSAATKTVGVPRDDTPIREALRQAAKMQAALRGPEEPEAEDLEPRQPPKLDIPLIIGPKKEKPPRVATPIFQQFVAPPTPAVQKQQEEPPKREERGRDQDRYGARKRRSSKSTEGRKSPAPPSRSTSKTPRSRSDSTSKPPSRSSSKLRDGAALTPSRKPKMCEIQTQTSTCVDPFRPASKYDEKMRAAAHTTVKNTVDYVTDLAVFAVACWLYFFGNELLALPVLLVAVFRQLKEALRKRVPKWIERRWTKEG